MSDTQATSNFRLSLKAKINIGIVAYIVVAFSMLGWINSARDDYREGRRDAEERYLQRYRDISPTIPELFIKRVTHSRLPSSRPRQVMAALARSCGARRGPLGGVFCLSD